MNLPEDSLAGAWTWLLEMHMRQESKLLTALPSLCKCQVPAQCTALLTSLSISEDLSLYTMPQANSTPSASHT